MSNSNEVRFSRDGDQFHYLWAARRCLRLMSPTDGLVAISIEDPSAKETKSDESLEAGVDQIDVGEYYGSEDIEKATLVRYIQLKHSTKNPTVAWPPSGLEKTIRGFSERYQQFEQKFGTNTFNSRVEFCFISNRPISITLMEAIEDAASEGNCRHPNILKKLEAFTSLNGERLSAFCKLLKLEGGHANYWLQRADLAMEIKGYLPGNDVDAPVQLKELVTRKALSESEDNPSITKMDVLRVLGTTEDDLFPAPSRIAFTGNEIPRVQEADLVTQIVKANTPVVLHAEGGVGKSVLSQRIKLHLPKDSVAVVYDCFGNGEYRREGSLRHRHKDALVQIANELAALGLCHPLIPSSNADNTDYLRAFAYRLKQSVKSIRAKNGQPLLCIVVDAADNAEIAANEYGDERSFARTLLREPLPDGVRLVFLCRTERQELLHPPPNVLKLELKPFTRDETSDFLRKTYSDASENDVEEFHRLTSHNPRVQATALAQSISLLEVLRSLGPNPMTVDDTISNLLQQTVDKLRETVGDIERAQIDSICTSLSILRPFVPVEVLASVADVKSEAVKSFASDLGHPLLILENAVQFRDEPVETWFRKHFRPSPEQLSEFIAKLQPLASESAYVASTLPQLMLEAGQLSELIDLALSSSLLPNNPIERRDVEFQRLQFSLKASLRAQRFADAAKLALKAAQETAGDTRQQKLLQANTDLAAVVLDPQRIQEIISRRSFGDGWIGSRHVYEASLLSFIRDFRGDARSRLRMAYEWLANWSRLPKKKRKRISNRDIAEIALTRFKIDGPEACVAEMRRWKPREVSYWAGRIVAERLIDHGWYDDLDELAIKSAKDLCLLLAINLELRAVHRSLPKETVDRALGLILNKRVKCFDHTETALPAITALVESAHIYKLRSNDVLASVLQRYLPEVPPRGWASRHSGQSFTFLRAYTLQAELKGEDLQLVNLAHPELREQLENGKNHHDSQELREFKEHIGVLLPWHKLWAKNLLAPNNSSTIIAKIAEAHEESNTATLSYREDSFPSDEIADIWFDILIDSSEGNQALLQEFKNWTESLKRPLYISTWIRLARLAARTPNFETYAYELAQRAFERMKNAKEDAESKAQTYIELARAILIKDEAEARAYFNQAIEVASKIGDEILDRWSAIINLADRAADSSQSYPKTAYEFARCAELAYEYTYDHFDWEGTVSAIAGLCPSSCFAILSRWRDRSFGQSERLSTKAISVLLDHRNIDSKTVSALVGFRAQWQYNNLLKKMFASCVSISEREKILNHVLHYMRLEEQFLSVWKKLKKIVAENTLTVPEIDRFIEHANRRETALNNRERSYNDNSRQVNQISEMEWDRIFLNLDLHTPNGLSIAYANFKSSDPPFYREVFFSELFKRIPVGKEHQFIQIFSKAAEFDLHDFNSFLEQLPEEWKPRMAVKSSLADAIKRLCSRHSMKIIEINNRFYQPLSLQLASELSGISKTDLIGIIVAAVGKTTEVVSVERLFTLARLLASQLSHDEAREVLNFGLSLFNDVLDEDDGDGPWTDALAPPPDVNEAVAGYIWTALAAPQTSLRWEAAHVVRGLCTLGGKAVLDHLVKLAEGQSGGPFVDRRLHFYHLHARQWLMIALARAAREHPKKLVAHTDFFIRFALMDEPHVVIRHFAAKAALAIAESRHFDLDRNIAAQLASINNPELPVVASNRYRRQQNRRDGDIRTKRFYFGYDMSRYWFGRLGDCFAKSASDIEVEAEKVIWDDWQLSETGYGDRDERNRRKIYRYPETRHSHGSYPKTDNLDFYLSYHAMMTVAGKLLTTIPLHQAPDNPNDGFEYWLKWHLLSRQDGNWLADRRDPTPLEWPSWKNDEQEDNWRWSVGRPDFDRLLGLNEDRLNLWGDWNTVFGRREEKVHISSALVTSERSAALLTALQTANNPFDYCIPDVGDNMEIDESGFRLKGWIKARNSEKALDEFDPWAGDIRYPPLKPAKFVCDLLQLKEDREQRVWQLQTEGMLKEVLWSQVWSGDSRQQNQSEGEHGQRLQASRAFITEFLSKMNMDLIVEVEIERRIRRYRYEESSDDDLGYVQPYFRIFVLKADGRTYSL
ncbi:MAG: tetratricopeptide repeat protein [Gemmatimonadetes bacterium]|nr:tetratricopeptide repeat protein [Gemmatimonadota bacterium]